MNTDPYIQLRADAVMKRRAAIKAAQKVYRETIAQIDALRLRLNHEAPIGRRKRQQTNQQLVESVMPKQRQFDFAEILKLVTTAAPDRTFNQLSIRTTLRNMAQQGI